MTRMNQWFVPGEGIAREVITADIQRYLGPDALVRPGTGTGDHQGQPGYWITAYRTLTSQMIQDLKLDSQRWRAEKDGDRRHGVTAYQDSQTHASRQHYGPSEGYAPPSSRASHSSSYATSESPHYTTTPTPSYSTHQVAYGAPPSSHVAHPAQPRTTDPYANYGQPAAAAADYRGYASATPSYAYAPTTQDPYGRTTATPHYPPQQPSVPTASPGYYIASDGRQYPLSQQPQQPQPPQAGRRRDFHFHGRQDYPFVPPLFKQSPEIPISPGEPEPGVFATPSV